MESKRPEKTVAIIVCDHGLGHLRRCSLMAMDFVEKGQQVVVYANSEHFSRLRIAIPEIDILQIEDLRTNTSPSLVRKGRKAATKWLESAPSFEKFDTVICDNLPEILEIRSDAVLSAQFFWHDVVEGADSGYVEYCESLIKAMSPEVMGCELFTMPSIKDLPNYRACGRYENPHLVAAGKRTNISANTELLVTGGSTPIVKEKLRWTVEQFAGNFGGRFSKIHVDAALLPDDPPDFLVPADFSVDMYSKLGAAICRPGLGVVTDLLTLGIKPYLVFEEGNREMLHNSSVLVKNNLGKVLSVEVLESMIS